jgi:methionyl-tRNA formyltransferase
MNIVFMGTPEFAVPSLRILLEQHNTIAAVVTAPDKPRGRGQHVSCSAVKEFAAAHSLPVLQPENLRDPSFAAALRALTPDLFVIVAFRILPKEVFSIPALGAFNLHASLLPKYRGAAPINWAIINGDTESGVTTFFLQEKVDTGSIILQRSIPITETMNAGELHDALMELGASAVVETVQLIHAHRVVLQTQDDTLASPAPKIFKEDCRIAWHLPAHAIHNFVRGLAPHPAAWTTLNGKTVKIFATSPAHTGLTAIAPGMLHADGDRLFAGTVLGAIEILALQLEGKKRLTAAEFLRGHRLTGQSAFV